MMLTIEELKQFLRTALHLGVAAFLCLVATTSNAADTVKGGQLYANHCASCHGVGGVPVMPDAPNFSRSERLLRPDVYVAAAIRDGKNSMPGYQGVLSETEILDIVVFLRTLEKVGPNF